MALAGGERVVLGRYPELVQAQFRAMYGALLSYMGRWRRIKRTTDIIHEWSDRYKFLQIVLDIIR